MVRLSGEARVCTVGPKFAILAKPGLDGTIFVQPTSLTVATARNPMPALLDHLRHNDLCAFEAHSQTERNGSKWRAIDGSVKVVRPAETLQGEGTITKLDETNGQFGFIRSNIGDVFFNATSVRPPTRSTFKVLKVGQLVRFSAVNCVHTKVPRNNNVQMRAVMVCARNYKEMTPPARKLSAEQPKAESKAATSENAWHKRQINQSPPTSPPLSSYIPENITETDSTITANTMETALQPSNVQQKV